MILRMIFFAIASMAIGFIVSTIAYYKDTHCIVQFEGLVLTGKEFLIGTAISGALLALF